MFTAALSTTAKTCKQPKCPPADEWTDKMWYLHTKEYFSAIKKNEIMLSVETWMDLEIIILSKQSKSDKHKDNMLSHMWNLKNDKKTNHCQNRKIPRHRKQTYGYQRGKEGGNKLGV